MTVKLTTSDVDSCAVAKTGENCLVSRVEVKSEIEGFRYVPIGNKTGEDVREILPRFFESAKDMRGLLRTKINKGDSD